MRKTRTKVDRTPHLQETHEEHEGGAAPTRDGGRFPFSEYGDVLREMRGVIIDRDAKGRNAHTSFYDGFPHGLQDVTFELRRRVGRVLGAERMAAHSPFTPTGVEVMRGDLIDLANYAVFAVLMLDHEHNQ